MPSGRRDYVLKPREALWNENVNGRDNWSQDKADMGLHEHWATTPGTRVE